MNWTVRINNIVKEMFPIGKGACLHERQTIYGLRIRRSDKIKLLLVGKTIEEQTKIIEEWEVRVGIKKSQAKEI